MRRKHWRVVLAVVVLLGVLFIGPIVADLYDASQQQQTEYRYQPASKPGFRIDRATQAPTEQYKPSCQNPKTKEDADLCAQWAAVAQVVESNRLAGLNARIAVLLLAFTVLGTLLLIWTFDETRETSRRELRAYVNVDAAQISDGTYDPDRGDLDKGFILGGWIIKNTGQTPAYNVRHWGAITITNVEEQDSLTPPPSLQWTHANDLPREAFVRKMLQIEKKPTRQQIAALKKGTMAVFVYGRVEYKDVFGEPHTTLYRLNYAGIWPPPLQNALYWSERGNESD